MLAVLAISAFSLQAEYFTDENGMIWYYNIENGGASIVSTSYLTGSVTFPSEVGEGIPVKKIGGGGQPVFGWSNPSITSVTIPPSVTSIGNGAFNNSTGLTSITIPNSVTSIGGSAFSNCTGLTSITIPNSVTSIGGSAFSNCTGLTSITIPNSVTSIGGSAFSNCTGLTSITIPSSVTSIGEYAFSGTRLTSVTIPSSVTSIGQFAFGITSLTSVTFEGATSGFANNSFWGPVLNINIPQSSVNDLLRLGFSERIAYATQAKFQGSLTAIDLANNEAFITAMANFLTALATNDGFLTAVANKIKQTQGTYGIATQSAVSNTITTLATKAELTASLAQSRTDGINSVLSNPNLWTLYTTNQIHAMAIGDLVLTSTNNGQFVLNYDIEQSEDLVNWTPYQGFAMPLTNLPTNKAFVRIKAKQ